MEFAISCIEYSYRIYIDKTLTHLFIIKIIDYQFTIIVHVIYNLEIQSTYTRWMQKICI